MSLPYRASEIADLRKLLDEALHETGVLDTDDGTPILIGSKRKLKDLLSKLIDMLEEPGRIRS